jgi:hypothetical protein
MSQKEMHAAEAAILQAQSLLSFRTAGTPKFGFGLSTHPWDQADSGVRDKRLVRLQKKTK